jgi:processive 1,2-diacylglycerol beta-glucosyltransferase
MNIFKALAIATVFAFISITHGGLYQKAVETLGPKKRVLILSTKGGYCSEAASRAIQEALGPGYTFSIRRPIDELRLLGIPLVDTFFNAPQRGGWNGTLNLLARLAPFAYKIGQGKIGRQIDRFIREEKPDLIISVSPFVNSIAVKSARKKQIPYLLVALDDDLTFWINGLKGISYPKFHMTIPRLEPLAQKQLKKAKLKPSEVSVAGQPLRPEFFLKKDPIQLKKEHGISPDKKVILVMMGGTGSDATSIYSRALGKLPLNLHIIACIGRDEARRSELELIPLHKSNSLKIQGFTKKIDELMTFADLIITKPGPGTIHEAITIGRAPILIDSTISPVFWEKAHMNYVVKYGIGDKITRVKHLPKLLERYLDDSNERMRVQIAMKKLPHEDFKARVKEIVSSLF